MPAIDEKAAALYRKSPEKASKYLTELTWERMDEMHRIYSGLRDTLITKYTNNHVRP
jgi:dipeptidase